MIEFLKNWCEGIMISVFITVIIEMLVPEGNIKKYVRVIIGVYMVFIILNPIISGIDKFDIDNILEFDRNYKTQETSVSNDDILSLYSKAMETDIKEKFDNIKDITIVFSENLEEIENIEIIIHDGETKVNEIKDYIKENYQVSENIISIIS
ncbi:MAG: stage III sporulation protein AF [Clostridia bacterium]|nr:stage III sporulation protein AF [Clostridia bacterium]